MITIIFHAVSTCLKNKSLWIILGIVVLSCGLYFGHRHAVNNAFHKGLNKGVQETTTKYETLITQAKEKQRQKEQQLRQDVETLRQQIEYNQIQYQKDYENIKEKAKRETENRLAHLKSINRRLSIEIDTRRMYSHSTRSTAGTASTRHTPTRAALSERAAGFLIGQAVEADDVLLKLNLCKQTLNETRKIVSDYNLLLKEKDKK